MGIRNALLLNQVIFKWKMLIKKRCATTLALLLLNSVVETSTIVLGGAGTGWTAPMGGDIVLHQIPPWIAVSIQLLAMANMVLFGLHYYSLLEERRDGQNASLLLRGFWLLRSLSEQIFLFLLFRLFLAALRGPSNVLSLDSAQLYWKSVMISVTQSAGFLVLLILYARLHLGAMSRPFRIFDFLRNHMGLILFTGFSKAFRDIVVVTSHRHIYLGSSVAIFCSSLFLLGTLLLLESIPGGEEMHG